MRIRMLIVVALLLAPTLAAAAPGQQITYSMTTFFSEEFMQAIAGQFGGTPGEGEMPSLEEMFPPQVVNGLVYLADERMRMEMELPGGIGTNIVIMDMQAMKMYMLEPNSQTAMLYDLTKYSEMTKDFGLMQMDPMHMMQDWEAYMDEMRDAPGVTINDLGTKQVLGYTCKGFNYTGDVSEMTAAMDEEDAAKLSMFEGMPSTYAGEIWVTDGIMMPLVMDMDVMGTHTEWRVATIDDWTVDASMFAVPEGYEIQEFDPNQLPWESEEPEVSEEEVPAPASPA